MFQYFGSGRYKNRKYGITRKNTKAKSKTWFWISWFRKADRRTRPVHKSLREVNSKKHCGKLFLFFLLRKKFWKLWNIWIVEISTSTMQLSTQYEIEISTIQIKCPNFFVNKKKRKTFTRCFFEITSCKDLWTGRIRHSRSYPPIRPYPVLEWRLFIKFILLPRLWKMCHHGGMFSGKINLWHKPNCEEKKTMTHTHTHTHILSSNKDTVFKPKLQNKIREFPTFIVGGSRFFLNDIFEHKVSGIIHIRSPTKILD